MAMRVHSDDSILNLLRGFATFEVFMHFLNKAAGVAVFGGSPLAMAGYLFWAMVILVEAMHLARSGRGQHVLDFLQRLLDLAVSFLAVLEGYVDLAVTRLDDLVEDVKERTKKLREKSAARRASRVGVDDQNVIDVEANVRRRGDDLPPLTA